MSGGCIVVVGLSRRFLPLFASGAREKYVYILFRASDANMRQSPYKGENSRGGLVGEII